MSAACSNPGTGTATITVNTADVGKTATCIVTVKAITDIQSITVTAQPAKTDYAQNKTGGVVGLDLAELAVTADYGGGVTGPITALISAARRQGR